MEQELRAYYESYGEDNRLFRDKSHHIEFLTSLRCLTEYLRPGMVVLDACAGPGAYALALAGRGLRVTACDLMPHHAELLRRRDAAGALEDIRVCDVLDLSCFADGQFDAVLCMGALYHLPEVHRRERAVRECLRVLRPGGIFAGAYINRHAQLLYGLVREGGGRLDAALEVIAQGTTRQAGREGTIFYRSTPAEMQALAEGCGLRTLRHIGTDGIAYAFPQVINDMDEADFQKWMAYHIAACGDPSLLGYSLHGLYIGKKE